MAGCKARAHVIKFLSHVSVAERSTEWRSGAISAPELNVIFIVKFIRSFT